MTWVKGVAGTTGILVALAVVGRLLPSEYSVKRSVTIDAAPERIHRLVGDLARWTAWMPWAELDPSIETTPGATTAGVGASESWRGKAGSGRLTFTACDLTRGVVYEMAFDRGDYVNVGEIRYETTGGRTRVTWTVTGRNDGWVARYGGLLLDSVAGPALERGLVRLKTIAEQE